MVTRERYRLVVGVSATAERPRQENGDPPTRRSGEPWLRERVGSLKSRASIDSWSGRHGFPGGQPAGSLDEACLGGIDGVCCLFGVELGPQGDGPALLVAQ